MATLSEHAASISAAIEAARSDGFQLVLEDSNNDPYVDLEQVEGGRIKDWGTIVLSFDEVRD